MSPSSWFFVALGLALFLLVLLGHYRLSQAIAPRPIPPPRRLKYPSLTVIRPVRGLDPGCRENTLALLEQQYPGERQTFFVFDSETDPAWPVVKEVVRQTAGLHNARVLVCGPPPKQRTGKLNAMICGLSQASGELIAFCDSDTRPSSDLLRLLVEELLIDPQAGDTFAPIVTHSQPHTAGDTGAALLINSWYGASVARASQRSDLPFIMGELVVFTRHALEAIGGLQVADGQLVDDMYLGACVTRAGLKNVMVPWKLPVISGELGFYDFLVLFRRWLIFSQSGLPLRFVAASWARGAEYAVAVAAAIVALVIADPWVALFPASAAALLLWSDLTLQARFSGQPIEPRFFWVAAALPFIGGALVVSSKIDRHVEWRGRSYALDTASRLAPR
jgi:ceramide glucosyltransferase